MLGVGFAAGWTPCIGPILGGIIGLAATSGGWKNGLILSSFYAAGLAVPFVLTGLGINQFLSFYARFRRHLHKVEVVSGTVLILIGVAIASGYATRLSSSGLAALLPNLESRIKVTGNTGAVSYSEDSSLKLAPQVQLQDLDGKPFSLSELRGRVVLLNFWATWCIPCRAENPELSRLQRDFEPSGLSVVGISWDDSAAGVRRFQKDIPQDYTVLPGGEGVQAGFGGIRSLPTSYIIDREGRIRQTIIGARDRAEFEAALKPVLAEASSAK
jgi:thiol-disulfide isomerase/thioredoxin